MRTPTPSLSLNDNAIDLLIRDNFEGNYRKFAKALNVDYTMVWKIQNGKSLPGNKVLGALYNYCKQNSLVFENYIALVQ